MTSRRIWWAAAVTTVAAALGLGFASAVRPEPPATVDAGAAAAPGAATLRRDAPAPSLAGRTLSGDHFDLATLRGEVVLVSVWASWCAPCREELPLLAAGQRRWDRQGLRVVGLVVRDDDARARALLAEVGAAQLTAVVDPAASIAAGWGVRTVPETFLVDRDGRVRVWARGAITAEWLERWVPPLLAS